MRVVNSIVIITSSVNNCLFSSIKRLQGEREKRDTGVLIMCVSYYV